MQTYRQFSWPTDDELKELALAEFPWRYYLETAVYIETADRRGIVTPSTDDGGEDQPPLDALHVISAIQPNSEPDTDENIARMGVLDSDLRHAGIPSARAVGFSLDGNHREESRAVFGLTDGEARSLGRRYGQVAVYGWSGPRWSLLASVGDRADHRHWLWQEDGELPAS